MSCWVRLLVTGLGVLLCAAAPSWAEEPGDADPRGIEFFEKNIRPVLVAHCYECHSAEAKTVQGGLWLDTRERLRAGGDSGPAVVAGKIDESWLIDALRYETFEMPPKGKLPEAVIADFVKWVEMGAPDPRDGKAAAVRGGIDLEQGRQFWSFRPLEQPALPKVKQAGWSASPIDRFILAKLEEQGLTPSSPADRRTLLRRLSFDLTGLPPTPEELDAFLADDSPEAVERVTDRLLSSPRFGQRWGRHWLDVARFAESSGGGRSLLMPNAWRYRDYVIDAFNRDKPFDQFVREQIAGDLLPSETDEQRAGQLTATGFLVLGPTNYETQDKELLRMDVIDEQIDTIGRAFLGMTIGCARCHDHKFDPIPHRDYYALVGIFRSTKVVTPGNVSGWVERELPMEDEHRTALEQHAAAVKPLDEHVTRLRADLKKFESQLAGTPSSSGPVAPLSLPGIVLDDSEAERVGSWKLSTHEPRYVGEGYIHDENGGKGNKSVTFRPELPAAGLYEVRLAYAKGGNRADKVPVTVHHADGEKTVHIDQRPAPPIDGLFVALGRFRFESGAGAAVVISNEGTSGHVIVDALQLLPVELEDADLKTQLLATGPKETADDRARRQKLEQQKTEAESNLKRLEAELNELKKQAPPPPPTAMAVVDEEQTGDYHICVRGNVHQLGEQVPRGFLSVIDAGGPTTIAAGQSGRRELAEWLVSPDNPLPPRVFVNRVWHHLFGAGLVRSTDNFGTMGEGPSHPELLDWLAVRFVEEGWSVKTLIREIVLSQTYQQGSGPVDSGRLAAAANDPRAVDPENRLLWRMNRRRLDAEEIRDSLLFVSGRLDETQGGSTIRPGTPREEFGYSFEGITRRSVYVPVFRHLMDELFEVFDFADPNLVMGRRTPSTLPTQALYLMNSPFVQQQSRHAAERLLSDSEMDDAARLTLAYRRTLGRPTTNAERELALEYLSGFGPDAGNPTDTRLEAWTNLCQALFGCVDFRYRN